MQNIQANTKNGCHRMHIARLLVFVWRVNVSNQRYSCWVKFVFVALVSGLIRYSHSSVTEPPFSHCPTHFLKQVGLHAVQRQMVDLLAQQMKSVKLQTMLYALVDTLWTRCGCSSISYSPITAQLAGFHAENTQGCLWLEFVLHQAGKLSMCCAALMFDQPLYLSTYRIKEENQHEFHNMTLQLVVSISWCHSLEPAAS